MIDKPHNALLADFTFYKAVLDALDAHVAVLDRQGTILAVNASWQRFGEANGIQDNRFCVGASYFAVCRAAVDPGARAASTGIQDVLSGRRSSFYHEYPCHSPDEKRWFALRATPLAGYPDFAVVAHENITQRIVVARTLAQHDQLNELNLVVQSFPGWRDRIAELLTDCHEFRDICEDYQELATSLDEYQSACADRRDLEDSLQALDALAEEIGNYLRANR